jgi:hypothetical protein
MVFGGVQIGLQCHFPDYVATDMSGEISLLLENKERKIIDLLERHGTSTLRTSKICNLLPRGKMRGSHGYGAKKILLLRTDTESSPIANIFSESIHNLFRPLVVL